MTGEKDDEGNLLTTNPETSGRCHSAWLSMMYPRLFLARQLLREDGVIFISIDDHEVHNLRLLMNEVFGEENFVANVVWQKKQSPQRDATYFSDMHDHVLVYARCRKQNRSDPTGWERQLLPRGEEQDARYSNPDDDPRGPWQSVSLKTYSEDTFEQLEKDKVVSASQPCSTRLILNFNFASEVSAPTPKKVGTQLALHNWYL